ncbi:MAG: hypothetical protein ACRDZ4_04685 [Egibacteraceae bacterium]
MLLRFRIEVLEGSADEAVAALTKYEHALHCVEMDRYDAAIGVNPRTRLIPRWSSTVVDRSFFNEELGREITEEVIEYDNRNSGYRGRRVVHLNGQVAIRPVVG